MDIRDKLKTRFKSVMDELDDACMDISTYQQTTFNQEINELYEVLDDFRFKFESMMIKYDFDY